MTAIEYDFKKDNSIRDKITIHEGFYRLFYDSIPGEFGILDQDLTLTGGLKQVLIED